MDRLKRWGRAGPHGSTRARSTVGTSGPSHTPSGTASRASTVRPSTGACPRAATSDLRPSSSRDGLPPHGRPEWDWTTEGGAESWE